MEKIFKTIQTPQHPTFNLFEKISVPQFMRGEGAETMQILCNISSTGQRKASMSYADFSLRNIRHVKLFIFM